MTFEPDTLAAQLHQARESGTALHRSSFPEPLLPDDAYVVKDAMARLGHQAGRKRAGWKIGLTSRAAQANFGAKAPMLGVIYADSVRETGCRIDLTALIDPQIEGEILLEIGRPISADAADDALAASLASVRPAFESTDSRIAGRTNAVTLTTRGGVR